MLRTIRIILATFFFSAVTLLFIDFSGTSHPILDWVTKIQFLPALFAANFAIIALLILLTLLFGRIYCSIICPLGILQDVFSHIASRKKRNRFAYAKPRNRLRIIFLALFAIISALGLLSIASLIAPYSAYGRIASNFAAPIWASANNILATVSEFFNSYAFHHTEIVFRGIGVFVVSLITLLLVAFLAWKGGRDYCNTVCPVGTILGFFAKFSLFRPIIDTSKCNACGLCARNCKAKCIDPKTHEIDYSRCVTCFDCIGKCKQSAISFSCSRKTSKIEKTAPKASKEQNSAKLNATSNSARRGFFATLVFALSGAVAKAGDSKTTDGGYAPIKKREKANRKLPIIPAGASCEKHLTEKCTACQLCVSACPSKIIKPSRSIEKFMQPEISYESGYCAIECVECSKVCPTAAIKPITPAEKSSTQIGRAIWVADRCIVNTDKVACDNCYRQCPTGAIQMVAKDPKDQKSPMIPIVNENRCIGCGACENLCPARPISAIYVEGNSVHTQI